jgi:hypothetical protein
MPETLASLPAIVGSWIELHRAAAIVGGGVFALTLLVVLNIGFLARAGRETQALRDAFERLDERLARAEAARRSKSDARRRILASLADDTDAQAERRA